MRINEIITEQELQEGPIGSAVGAVGRGIAKGIGGLAKGAGMIAGIGQGVKRAFGKGKATSAAHIAGDVPKQQAAQQPSASQQAYDQEYAKLTGQPQASQGAAAAPAQGGGAPAAQGGAQQKAEPTMQKQPAATGGDVDSIIKQIDALQPAEKQQVLATLQKSSTPAKEQPAADANATPKPTAQPAAQAQGNTEQPPAQGGAEQPAADANATPKPAAQAQAGEEKPGYDPQTGKPNAAMQAQNRAAAKEKAPYGYNMTTGKPNPPPEEDDDNPNIVRGTESVQRRGRMIESKQKFMLYTPQTIRIPVNESSRSKKKTASIYRQR